ncbi:MAG TPA: acetyl-CoA carboxylase biotin carboxyl carrier protein subunit [Alphaproteobacteria bacterium]
MTGFAVDPELIRSLARLLEETGLVEIEYARGEERVRVARPWPGGAAPHAPQTSPAPAARAPASPAEHPGLVRAPMVGTVYLAAEPGGPALVKAGDVVAEGQTLCLIEAMKTFNPVRAPRAGRIVRILVSNGTPVEFGEGLMIVE